MKEALRGEAEGRGARHPACRLSLAGCAPVIDSPSTDALGRRARRAVLERHETTAIPRRAPEYTIVHTIGHTIHCCTLCTRRDRFRFLPLRSSSSPPMWLAMIVVSALRLCAGMSVLLANYSCTALQPSLPHGELFAGMESVLGCTAAHPLPSTGRKHPHTLLSTDRASDLA